MKRRDRSVTARWEAARRLELERSTALIGVWQAAFEPRRLPRVEPVSWESEP